MIRQTLLTALTVGMMASSSLAAETCIRPVEERADKLRFVQTHFMVAALQCRFGKNAVLSKLYNNFVADYTNELRASEPPLRRFLVRAGRISMDTYIADKANLVSLASIEISNFCGQTRKAVEMPVSASTPEQLADLMPVRYEPPAKKCK